MNLLASPLPNSVRIGEASVPIKTGYRVGIQVARTADSGQPGDLISGVLLRLYFGADVPGDTIGALDAAMEFHRCGQPPTASRRAKRVFDWDHDAGMLLADFRREYGIDLADPATRMHWWVFMAYFGNLSSKSETKTAMYYRGATRPKDLKGDDAKRFAALKKMYALPPRTVEDVAAVDAAAWGDT